MVQDQEKGHECQVTEGLILDSPVRQMVSYYLHLHMLSKMKDPKKGGSAIAIVHNGSPLFSGDAGGGESTIRQHIIENDMLETIVALPTQLFYNTGYCYIHMDREKQQNGRAKRQRYNSSTRLTSGNP